MTIEKSDRRLGSRSTTAASRSGMKPICGALLPLFVGLGTLNIYTQIGLVTLIGLIMMAVIQVMITKAIMTEPATTMQTMTTARVTTTAKTITLRPVQTKAMTIVTTTRTMPMQRAPSAIPTSA